MTRRQRLLRAFWPMSTLVLLAVGIAELLWLARSMGAEGTIGADYTYFTDIARVWQSTGMFYLPRQLAGPYEVQTLVDCCTRRSPCTCSYPSSTCRPSCGG